ncbi:ABC transporter ATP-binding protein [Lactobacillus delbrueckii subsp. bulgaricus]|nr:ABC transporter ATP-binding protein [Lactobacillus delbrueckii subsp. bulgaricus]MBT8801158.1 ABC transporter ATP-binding protein [Lactobacillus delbrueckii subsp. bulgaricus]MBT8809049.1 ABC transporter ATP-binding protein [Lactobacillus delbrueckii subsp. bulgaricus]MBT8813921.1 ABC transporter ATP-binding protein [Lactobacillus delbrueckii subsp. bulgaricus]MBT8826443.1 ABC transporter ATP-binding protein [Lactobacillus delbrueckii subsp. bulgaricus]
MTSQNLLELTDLEVVVGRGTSEENKILGKLSLKIKPGDFICLLGGNGADKSTLLNVLAGAIQPTSGKILHAGKDISKESEVKRSSYIARVFQDPKLGTAPRMTVAENLLLAAKRGQKRGLKENIPAFKEALEKVNPDLAGKLDLPVDQLSGGQRQALSFVMATYNKPELLLLDEHIAALDPRYSRKLMEATDEQIRAKKITAVMITHHMEDALKYGNRLLVLDHGQISHDYQGQAKQDLTLQDLAALFD